MNLSSSDSPPLVSFADAFRFWLQLSFISFGGPAGQIAIMHRELVEKRRWASGQRFLHALNFCMVLPGPEAQQLATYLGWLMHRSWGGVVAGTLFPLPSLVLRMAALLTFGGAYAVLPYVNQAAVEHYQWLTTAQVMDGLALTLAGLATLALWRLKWGVVPVIAASAVAGLLLRWFALA